MASPILVHQCLSPTHLGEHGELATQNRAPKKHGPWEYSQKGSAVISWEFIEDDFVEHFQFQSTEVPNHKMMTEF